MKKYIGIDIGGTNTKLGIVSEKGKVLSFLQKDTPRHGGPEMVAALVGKMLEELFVDLSTISAIGVGVPGPVDRNGIVYSPPNMKNWGKVDFRKILSEFLKIDENKIYLGNDATLAGLAESRLGNGIGANPLILLTLGTGVGGAIIIDGKPLLGKDGFAGELGHIVIDPNGPRCSCGRKGCAEALISNRWIVHTAFEQLKKDKGSILWEMMGGQFVMHGPQSEVEFLVQDPKHPATKELPSKFKATEEIYLLKDWSREKVRVLIALDKHPNTGEPGDYPIAWVHLYGKGRVFYTSIGHREDLMQTDYYKKHLKGGLRWVLGIEKGDAKPLPPPPPVTKKEKKEGFRALFNAKDLTGWHPRHEGATPWTVQNGMLVIGKGGTDLITDEKFGNFILRYEYMIPKGGNSGVYLRGRYEIQVLDDFETKAPDIHGNGSIYGVIAPSQFASKASGEWQTVEAKLVGNKVTVILNGVKIIDNKEISGPTGGALDDKVNEPGPIMLQGDHGPVAYRNIRIKVLK